LEIKIEDSNDVLIEKLRESHLLKEMKSLENCDFFAYVEHNGKIIGVNGVGGLFHVPSLQIHPNYVNRGLGVKLFAAVIEETKKRNYSFLSGSRNPENLNVVKIHNFFKLMPILQVHYRPNFVRDVVFLELNNKGKIVRKFLSLFNSKIGIFFLISTIKILRKLLFESLLTYPPDEFPTPDIRFAMKNFKKIN